MHFGYPTMHLVCHISESIRWMDSNVNFTTYISEQLHIINVKEAYRSSNKLNWIWQMLKHNDQCTSRNYMEETVSYLAFEGWYIIDSANGFNILSATVKWQSSHRAHLLRLTQSRTSPRSAQYHSRYIIWEKSMSVEYAEVSNQPHAEMHQKTSEFPTLDSYSVSKLRKTGDTKSVDSCSDMSRIYSYSVYWLNSWMGCFITTNHFTTRLLLTVWDLIAR
jgi:hypothetical protein